MTQHQRRSTPIVYACETSETWSRERFRALMSGPVDEAALAPVEARRRMLAHLASGDLLAVYGTGNDRAGRAAAVAVSIPRLYGHILHALAVELKPRVALEAGSGFGLSGMYLGAAMAADADSVLFSFEIGLSVEHARESIARVFPRAFVIRDSSSHFADHLTPSVKIDLVFLDAAHDYATVARDAKLLRGWLSPRAVLLIDDVGHSDGSRRAWREIATAPDVRFAALIRERLGFVSWR